MIVRFAGSPEEYDKCDANRLSECLRELLRAHRRGHHVVVIPRPLCRWFAQFMGADNVSKNTIEQIESEYADNGRVYERALKYILIDINSECIIDDNRTIKVPYHYFSEKNDFSEPTTLVVENSNSDGEIYKAIFDYSLHRNGLRFRAHTLNGGGETIVSIAKAKSMESRIVVSILDSDKITPFRSISKKARSIESMFPCFQPSIGVSYVLPMREIENAVPFTIFSANHFVNNPSFYMLLSRVYDDYAKDTSRENHPFFYIDTDKGIINKETKTFTRKEAEWFKEFGLDHDNDDYKVGGFGKAIADNLTSSHNLLGEFAKKVYENKCHKTFTKKMHEISWYFAGSSRRYT